MKNIKVPKKVGNDIAKNALLEIINDCIKKVQPNYCDLRLDGYESDKYRVHFTLLGKRCALYGVATSDEDTEKGIFGADVRAKNNGQDDIWMLAVSIKDFRFKTLDRIAYEVYDYCKYPDDEEYEEVRKEYIANGMDAYREFMS